ncbi:MAG: MinD/ParA family protein [Thermodesulfobacteriota bacterium]
MTSRRSDQADTLRGLRGELDSNTCTGRQQGRTARVMSVTSGKGGVGKTVCVANLALVLAARGYRVLIIDADLGLANIDLYFGLTPMFTLNHFFAGQKQLPEILIEAAEGVTVLPAGSGVQKYTCLDANEKLFLMEGLDLLHDRFDVVLIDTEAGISENVTYFNVAAQEIAMVTTPEPTAISDVYALMKLLSTQFYEKRFKLIVNSVTDDHEALDVYRKLMLVSSRFIDISIDFLGAIPSDKRFTDSVRRQKALVSLYPDSKSAAAFGKIVDNMEIESEKPVLKGAQQFFWKRLLSYAEPRPGQGG